jgi:uncharacterized membrane protein YgcG
MCLLHHSRPLFLFLGVVLLFSVPARGEGVPVLPPAPDGMILDKGRVFLPERAAALSERLTAAARERSIWVYVVTVPSLGVLPSVQKERLSNLAHFYTDGWLREKVGLVLLVDDESGGAIIVASDEANRQFPPLQRNLLMRDPLRFVQRERFLRDKTERTALSIVEVISGMQDEAKKTARRNRIINLVMAVIAISGVSLVLLVKWKRPNRGGSPSY